MKGEKSEPINTKAPLILGVAFTLLILGLIVYLPCPTSSQFIIFRIILAIAIAGLSTVIPGILKLNINTSITAGGALAVFVFCLFI